MLSAINQKEKDINHDYTHLKQKTKGNKIKLIRYNKMLPERKEAERGSNIC